MPDRPAYKPAGGDWPYGPVACHSDPMRRIGKGID